MVICTRKVFRCFKTLERWGDYFTGAAGPFFVVLACVLISSGVICFCKFGAYIHYINIDKSFV